MRSPPKPNRDIESEGCTIVFALNVDIYVSELLLPFHFILVTFKILVPVE